MKKLRENSQLLSFSVNIDIQIKEFCMNIVPNPLETFT